MELERTLQLDGRHLQVTVQTAADDTVTILLGDEPSEIALVGTRYDVHRVVIEIDRQLGRLNNRFRAC